MANVDIYEVHPCPRGRCDEEHARFVAAGDADEAAYKVAGEHLHSEGARCMNPQRSCRERRCDTRYHQRRCRPIQNAYQLDDRWRHRLRPLERLRQ